MLLSTSFDIDILTPQSVGSLADKVLFTLQDCYLQSWQSGISPGGPVTESISLLVLRVIDPEHEKEKSLGKSVGA
jgi:hypothetical protein